MLNRIVLMGHVGRDPEFKLTKEGKPMATFSMSTKHSWKDNSGVWHSQTDWHQITVYRESTIRWLKTLLRKGDAVYVEGKLTYTAWVDKYKQSRTTTHVDITDREGRVHYFGKLLHIRSLLIGPQDKNTQNEIEIEIESLPETSQALPPIQLLPFIQPEKETI